MRSNKLLFMVLILTTMSTGGCFSQENGEITGIEDRKPYAAGRFYTDDPSALKRELADFFKQSEGVHHQNVIAVISPHAGYPFSGAVAASAFNQIDPDKKYDRVFLIASSHRVAFRGASVYYAGDYITPLGKVSVDKVLSKKLVDENDIFTFRKDAHQFEHSLEVQLPFLQYKLGEDFRIIPVVIGAQNTQDCREIAKVLRPYLGGSNLFVISTDFSHYPAYEQAIEVDARTAAAIESKSPEKLEKVLQENEWKGISNLATSLCGWSSVYTLLYMLDEKSEYSIHKVLYRNSGDAAYYGDKSRVVGYWAMVVSDDKPGGEKKVVNFQLTEKDERALLKIARETLEDYVRNGKIPAIDAQELPGNCQEKCGAFVTLMKKGQLRGCIGRFDSGEPLYKVVQEMAVSASTRDYRFPRVEQAELEEIEVEISVLTPMVKISSIDEIELGRHGIYIKKGGVSGTFLPQVATQTGWSKEEFLGHCSRDKARLGWDGWKDAEVFVYEAIVFSEGEH